MSIAVRQALVHHRNTIFTADSQRADLLDPGKTSTNLIALLTEICITRGHAVQFTAIKSDHHDDSDLGECCHFNGYAADCWPLATPTSGDFLDANDPRFALFLRNVAVSPWLHQVGLAGTSYTGTNAACAGASCFMDSGADHVHLGAHA